MMAYNLGPKLPDWEIAEVRRRASAIMAEHPCARVTRQLNGANRYTRLRYLADEYGITIRTLYRYIARAA